MIVAGNYLSDDHNYGADFTKRVLIFNLSISNIFEIYIYIYMYWNRLSFIKKDGKSFLFVTITKTGKRT